MATAALHLPSIAPRAAAAATGAPVTGEELLVAVATGDAGAFAALYDRVSPQVLGVALRVLRDRSLAEEVTQEVMVEVWRKATRFDPERGTASAWITSWPTDVPSTGSVASRHPGTATSGSPAGTPRARTTTSPTRCRSASITGRYARRWAS